ncbi:MAG: hypothetical protein R2939_11920 [Kofleriaceae bacterium]
MKAAALLLAAVAAPLAACGGDEVPTAAELYGTWTNVTDGTARALVFSETSSERAELAGLSPTYLLYNYPVGTTPTYVQAGTYAIEERPLNVAGETITDDALVVMVRWDASGTQAGMAFGNAIDSYDGDSLGLTLSDGTVRLYQSATALP